ncbi:MAG: 1-(5-phosphoribosyl)-5-[(5-phosphoribosylamino)methylideneamino]imidazole-4-carboxamide isomerase [Pirellulales bacterium]|nr:1-(5-phosphoribosyl)-5-[(5-phosphoribosylamino)methylideneamino]imidazole-4-carboxamide isomerase [Rhodopirellula sp.]MCH2370155.1 1-(5-phosphoribosyl)-5-[(5-phosphoribosylamino)methylideneamino]imidazole-4-carboxamide isomerase [Pirellulales bacterium]|tara:strand:+ start:401 stop:1117 length:717 start_codon:yes stop_codon:yes gene_type:complete
MKIWPAIDLRGGNCVRLKQGDYNQETVFGDNPGAMALQWCKQGAECMHLVDLDGARDGLWINQDAVRSIIEAIDVPCQLGGGVREEATIELLLGLGVSRLIVGTKALKEPSWFSSMVEKFPHKLALGIDARDGMVATDGWLETSETTAISLAQQFENQPVAAIIYTDISRDGMMQGANVTGMAEMKQATSIPVIASGGVTTLDDVKQLQEAGLDGAIIGRSLYDGVIDLAEAISLAAE